MVTLYDGFRMKLIEAGHLLAIGMEGLYAYGDEFQAVIDGVDAYLRGHAAGEDVVNLRLPPVCPTSDFVRTGYVSSFPQLTGAVFGFSGNERDHLALREKLSTSGAWSEEFHPAGLMLVSAACQPAYALFSGSLPPGGRRAVLLGHCFRREPSADPARMLTFCQREFLCLGTARDVAEFRDEWIERAPRILGGLGLPITATSASDPFFGRLGRLLSAHQIDAGAKVEMVTELYGDGPDTAVASVNFHGDHFGVAFRITAADDSPAHSSCIGFGLERLALAMLHVHGLHIEEWPVSVRDLVMI